MFYHCLTEPKFVFFLQCAHYITLFTVGQLTHTFSVRLDIIPQNLLAYKLYCHIHVLSLMVLQFGGTGVNFKLQQLQLCNIWHLKQTKKEI